MWAIYEPKNPDRIINRGFKTGAEREEFIRQQNEMVKKFPNEEEYLDYYDLVKTLED